MITQNNPPDSYRRAVAIAEAEVEVDKWSVQYRTDGLEVEVEDYACVLAGLILFEHRNELLDFCEGIEPVVKMADALAEEFAQEMEWAERKERRAMERYIRQTR